MKSLLHELYSFFCIKISYNIDYIINHFKQIKVYFSYLECLILGRKETCFLGAILFSGSNKLFYEPVTFGYDLSLEKHV